MPKFGTVRAVEHYKERANNTKTKEQKTHYLEIALYNAEAIENDYQRENYVKLIKDNLKSLENEPLIITIE